MSYLVVTDTLDPISQNKDKHLIEELKQDLQDIINFSNSYTKEGKKISYVYLCGMGTVLVNPDFDENLTFSEQNYSGLKIGKVSDDNLLIFTSMHFTDHLYSNGRAYKKQTLEIAIDAQISRIEKAIRSLEQ